MKDNFLLSLPIQMLISSTDTFTNAPRNNVLPTMWASLSPARLTHIINHPRWELQPKTQYWANPEQRQSKKYFGRCAWVKEAESMAATKWHVGESSWLKETGLVNRDILSSSPFNFLWGGITFPINDLVWRFQRGPNAELTSPKANYQTIHEDIRVGLS